ncbi:MAG: 2-amino-4-hydroxy-6-hydroxymethyldihydropteridine diphosphokinase [Candidatus Hydrogenedentes bacterium]|nr:2-amino-4-hydroxy-6-hydroxymethyldihydropteridine diphosphokinase [Candidatus Hydrogenedentota bacterium]
MRVHLSLGSNMGDRLVYLRAALAALAGLDRTRVGAYSRVYETEPVGEVQQPRFLNMAVEIETALEPLELLDCIQGIETELGRMRELPWGPRTIDIDIVLWGAERIASDRLTVPHKEFRKRAFVLEPLAEIAPEAVDPETGMTVEELAAQDDLLGRAVGTFEVDS